ncbi:hypothetical protein ANN_07072 [Periplaneta americana]|uniref:Uncharacterized protein n=1 Tax=Periplaneta americana TaxID=6978 RepID=A0ABQ8TF87_PERAM|nr:hypothetical protein ANN_07072 [Periplaneta americana]
MAGLREGGNEPPGSLKSICKHEKVNSGLQAYVQSLLGSGSYVQSYDDDDDDEEEEEEDVKKEGQDFILHIYGVGKIKPDAEMTLTMQEIVISMQQLVAVTCPGMSISRMLCPELRCVITFEVDRIDDNEMAFGEMSPRNSCGLHDMRLPVGKTSENIQSDDQPKGDSSLLLLLLLSQVACFLNGK